MNHPLVKKALPHLLVIGIALVVIIAYFNPMLSGKVLRQGDVDQWRASFEEIYKFYHSTGERTFWTGTVFSGMPSYLIGATYQYNFTVTLQTFLGTIMHNPLDTVFLLFICFYILMMAFDAGPLLGFIGAIAFTFSTFNFMNIDAGHMTKGNAIAYVPLVLAGIQITLHKNKLLGALLTGVAMSMELAANHLQITYYLLLIILAWMIAEVVMAIKEKKLMHVVVCGLFLALAAGLGVATYAPGLMATEEYGQYSIRGKSELTKTSGGESNASNSSSGLDKEYALQWSNGVAEPFTLLIPDFYGGGSNGELSTSSETYKLLKQNNIPNAKQIIQNMPLYWGTQPMTAGPQYYGAIICYLFILGLILVKGKEKWWILVISVIAISLSMGRNFMSFTDLFFYNFPLYNKFRSVTFILAITQAMFPLLGVLAIRDIIKGSLKKEEIKKAVLLSFYIVGGLCAFFVLMPELFFNIFGIDKGEGINEYFVGRMDTQLPEWLRDSLIADRKSMLRMDALRSLVLITMATGLIWFYVAGKLKQQLMIGVLAFLVLADLWQVDKRYLNDRDYQAKKKESQAVFPKTQADEIILQDKDPNYRVYNTTQNLTQDAITSYYHKSIGGYHGAKMRRYQELIEFQIAKNNMQIFNMLNVKYFIVGDSANNLYPQQNPEACGNTWFVPEYVMVENADVEMDSMNHIMPKQKAFIDKRYSDQLNGIAVQADSAASIKFVSYKPNHLVYESNTATPQVAVFSEMYYDKGWNAYVDGQLTPHFRCDYVLRGMVVPAGKHTIDFKFEPSVVANGEKISLVSSILLYGGIIVIGGLGLVKRKKEEE
ncbi:MAG: YfhO family protein [Bacteroidota bacterium]